MGLSSCSVRVEIPAPKIFTNNDIVEGRVHVCLEKDVDVQSVSVHLQCIEKAVVRVSRGETTVTYRRKAEHFDASVRLFPPKELAGVASYTLPKGYRVYDFYLTFPSSEHFPPSFTYDHRSAITWQVKAQVARASAFKMNSHSIVPLVFYPHYPLAECAGTTRVIGHHGTWQINSHKEGFQPSFKNFFSNRERQAIKVTFLFTLYREGILQRPFDTGVDFKLVADQCGFVQISSLCLTLRCTDTVKINNCQHSKSTRWTLLDVTPALPIDGKVFHTLDRILKDSGLPRPSIECVMAGTFQTQYFRRQFQIEMQVTLESCNYGKYSRTRTTVFPVMVCPPSVEALTGNHDGELAHYDNTEATPGPQEKELL